MGSGYYAAFSGLLARTEALDSAADNLSNAGTTGFRAERDYFRNAIMGPEALNSQLNRTVNDFGVLGGDEIDLGEGPLQPTGNPLDLAIQGQGFFAIRTKSGVRYTRDGGFQRAVDGSLVTAQGEAVLNAKLQPIRVPTGEVIISSEGVISVDGTVAGNLGLFTFSSAQSLVPEGANRYLPVNGAAPTPSTASIRQGMLEGSNQNVIQGTLQLILVQRQAEMMQKALTLFSNEFDKTASEELPKV
ncbi:MAG TPA: flagellar hook basal-body protein [Silvibacterium sp.]|nr:flagellar hook basal-body protein [Silvibacterium sp.]